MPSSPVLHLSTDFLVGIVYVVGGKLCVGVDSGPIQDVTVAVEVFDRLHKSLVQRPVDSRVVENTACQRGKTLCDFLFMFFLG